MLNIFKKNTDEDSIAISQSPSEWKKRVLEMSENGGGSMIIYRQKPGIGASYNKRGEFMGSVDIKELKREEIEPLLMDNFGGGHYTLELTKNEKGMNITHYIFKFLIAGLPKVEKEKPEQSSMESMMQMFFDKMSNQNNLAEILTVAKELSKPSPEMLEIMRMNTNQPQAPHDVFGEIQTIIGIAKMITPEIKPESDTTALIAGLAQPFLSAIATKMTGVSPPAMPMTNLPLPNQLSAIPKDSESIKLPNPNIENPNIESQKDTKKETKIEKFESLFLDDIKSDIANNEAIEIIAGKIFGAITINLMWFPDQSHPVLKPIIDCLQNQDFINIPQVYDKLAEYFNLQGDIKDQVGQKLIEMYKQQLAMMPNETEEAETDAPDEAKEEAEVKS